MFSGYVYLKYFVDIPGEIGLLENNNHKVHLVAKPNIQEASYS